MIFLVKTMSFIFRLKNLNKKKKETKDEGYAFGLVYFIYFYLNKKKSNLIKQKGKKKDIKLKKGVVKIISSFTSVNLQHL